MAYQSRYSPINVGKYSGDPRKIVARSNLERTVMKYFDLHKDVISWSSEEVIIPYRSPIDGKMHRYFPDFLVKYKKRDGSITTQLIEVKPFSQCGPPKIPKTKARSRRFINEVKTWGVNEAKWTAAESHCKRMGWAFTILTENEIKNL